MRYEEHELFTPPDDPDATIWRYIGFTKLVSLLDTQSLFFARTDTLGDQFEGSYSRANVRMRPDLYPEIPADALARLVEYTRRLPLHTFVNCWNLADYESAALWGLYVPPQGGVAIQSTFKRLTECFVQSTEDQSQSGRVYIGRITYADYERDFIPEGNSMWPFVHKRSSFEFEHELRALHQNVPTVPDANSESGRRIDASLPSPPGLQIAVDLDVLVDAIYVSPIAPVWLFDLVRSVCEKYDLAKPVRQSSLAGTPVY